MSSRMMKFDGKPPLAKSPTRLRPRRSLRSNPSSSLETPLACYAKTSRGPSRYWDKEDDRDQDQDTVQVQRYEIENKFTDLPPKLSISTELLALADMVKQEFEEFSNNKDKAGTRTSPLFERGRFYDLYSARRNERLIKKQMDIARSSYDDYLRVNVETSKRRDPNKFQSGRKSMSSIVCSSSSSSVVAADRSAHPRYSLRSSSNMKENQKPPLAAKFDKAAAAAVECDSKVGARRARRI